MGPINSLSKSPRRVVIDRRTDGSIFQKSATISQRRTAGRLDQEAGQKYSSVVTVSKITTLYIAECLDESTNVKSNNTLRNVAFVFTETRRIFFRSLRCYSQTVQKPANFQLKHLFTIFSKVPEPLRRNTNGNYLPYHVLVTLNFVRKRFFSARSRKTKYHRVQSYKTESDFWSVFRAECLVDT